MLVQEAGGAPASAPISGEAVFEVNPPDTDEAAPKPNARHNATAETQAAIQTGGHPQAPSGRFEPRAYGERPSVEQLTALGRRVFADPRLSASGRMACATCHDPRHAFGPSPELMALTPVAMGGPTLKSPGIRAVPSLRYEISLQPFEPHHFDDEELHGDDAGPTGGLTWDGRANTPHEQALIPLFASNEMANASPVALARKVAQAPYAAEFRAAFSAPGDDVFAHPSQVVGWLAYALEVYLQDAATFAPYTSRYDDYLRGHATLSPAEMRGLRVFLDPQRGNCTACHQAMRSSSGAFPRFTDGGYGALGVPRNRAIVANQRPDFYDLGLCGPFRSDLSDQTEACGQFKVPTLRNVALRPVFFHNGAMRSLREVVAFYATRDTQPQRWYPRDKHGHLQRFNDLPKAYQGNVNDEPPFGGQAGGRPLLSAADQRDLIAFLKTLTDADLLSK